MTVLTLSYINEEEFNELPTVKESLYFPRLLKLSNSPDSVLLAITTVQVRQVLN